MNLAQVTIATALLGGCSKYLSAGDPITGDLRALAEVGWSCSCGMLQIIRDERKTWVLSSAI